MSSKTKWTTKEIAFGVLAVILVVVAVMGWHWTDVAETKFWWNFWVVAAIVSGIGFISIVIYLFNSQNKRDNR